MGLNLQWQMVLIASDYCEIVLVCDFTAAFVANFIATFSNYCWSQRSRVWREAGSSRMEYWCCGSAGQSQGL